MILREIDPKMVDKLWAKLSSGRYGYMSLCSKMVDELMQRDF